MEKDRKLLYKAQLAEKAERFVEMVDCMKDLAKMNKDMNMEERNMFSVAYKSYVGQLRTSWRIVKSLEDRQKEKKEACTDPDKARRLEKPEADARDYRLSIQQELQSVCSEVLKLIDEHCLKSTSTSNVEGRIFFQKMKGDYYRYIAEFSTDAQKTDNAANAEKAYKSAMDDANKSLTATHPVRLGLALNFSVFYYEIMNKSSEAISMAEDAFKAAKGDLPPNHSDRDLTLIMELLKDNLEQWKENK